MRRAGGCTNELYTLINRDNTVYINSNTLSKHKHTSCHIINWHELFVEHGDKNNLKLLRKKKKKGENNIIINSLSSIMAPPTFFGGTTVRSGGTVGFSKMKSIRFVSYNICFEIVENRKTKTYSYSYILHPPCFKNSTRLYPPSNLASSS